MTHITARSWPLRVAASSGVACMAVSLLGFAQPEGSLPQVTVHADRTLTVERVGTSRSLPGAPIERYTLERPVSYADLDLKYYEGRAQLNKRIRSAAIASCTELQVLAPLQTSELPGAGSSNRNCVQDAVDSALPQVQAAIATAMSGDEHGKS